MLLIELMESVLSSQSALEQLIYNTNKVYTLYVDVLPDRINNLYAKGEHDDMLRTAKSVVGRTKGKWFADNYLSTSTRRERPVDGLKNALTILSKDPNYNVAGLQSLSSFVINMNKEKQAEVGSFGQYVTQLETLPDILDKIANKSPIEFKDRLKYSASRLRSAVASFYSLWNKLQTRWETDWGPNANPNPVDKKENLTGSQNSQLEMLIGQVLGSLDKKVAAEIRPLLARTDNKLAVLQTELNKRGIKI